MHNTEPTVPCGLCGVQTRMLGTKRCDRCYELETRVNDNPGLARRILLDSPLNPFPKDAAVVFKDGDEWCATRLDFVNLQESPAAFCDSPGGAIHLLRVRERK